MRLCAENIWPGLGAVTARVVALIMVLSAGPMLAGCITDGPPGSASAGAGPGVDDPSVPETGYTLGPQDEVRVTVFGEDELTGLFVVDSTGRLALPLIGTVEVGGLTLREAEASVTEAFNYYLIEPRVSLEVAENRPFYIYGEVTRGGEFPYFTNMHLLNAVSVAGGYTPRANNRTVFVTRAGTDEEIPMPATSTTKIFPGDIIRVGERRF